MTSAAKEKKNKKTFSRLRLTILILVLLAAAGTIALLNRDSSDQTSEKLQIVTVTKGDIQKTVTALGTLKPKNYVDVGTQVTGQLMRVYVEIGDPVEKGELLAEIDPAVYETRVRADQARLENLKAQLAQQEAELDLARRQAERNQKLLEKNYISQNDVDVSATAANVAANRVNSLKSQIEEAQSTLNGDLTNLAYTKIYAPMSGTVIAQSTVEGQTVNASQSAPTIVQIADIETMTVWAQVAEADIIKLKAGMPVYFTTLGMPNRRWEGAIRQIMPTPEIVNDVVLYNVLIDTANPDGVLMNNMTAQVFFILAEAKDVPLIPVSALGFSTKDENTYTVQTLNKKGEITEKEITVGLKNRTSAEVRSGLSAGESVVISDGIPSDENRNTGRPRFPGRVL